MEGFLEDALDLFKGDIAAATSAVHVDAARNKAYQLSQIMKRNKHMSAAKITSTMEKVRVAADSRKTALKVETVRDWPGLVIIFIGFFISGIGTSFFSALIVTLWI